MSPEERLRRKNAFDANLVFGVQKFNTLTGRKRHLKTKATEGEQFVDSDTGLLYEDLCRFRVCPVCGADDNDLLFVKRGFRHVRCNACSMVYVNPMLKEERLQSFYQDEHSFTRILLNELQMSMDKKRFAYGLDFIEMVMPEKGVLLDVGCGPGIFLQEAQARHWQVQGLEFNTWCVQRLNEMMIDVIEVPFEKANLPDNTYACVTAWDVLEHVADPQSFLTHIHRILAPGGVLLIEVPNIDSLVARILHESIATFSGDAHVNFFNATTLSQILRQNGFVIKECETFRTELGTINNHLNFEDPYFGPGAPVLDFLTPEYIHEHMLGSLLFVLAQSK